MLIIMKKLMILLAFSLCTLLEGVCFKEIFKRGEIGDYSVYQNGDLVTIISIYSKCSSSITLEEISLPKSTYHNVKGKDLNKWVKNNAPNSTSWTIIEIDLQTLDILSSYCFSRKVHLSLQKEDTLISSLLNLSVKKLPESKLARIGPRRNTKNDQRDFWKPAMVVNGKRVSAQNHGSI